MPNGFAGLGKIWARLAAFEMAHQVGIAEVRLAAGREHIANAKDDVSAALGCIEDARPVAETALFAAQLTHLRVFLIEDLDRFDGLGDFLSVGAAVMPRRAAYAPRDSAQAFHARALCDHGMRDEAVPGFSCADIEPNLICIVASWLLLNAWNCDL